MTWLSETGYDPMALFTDGRRTRPPKSELEATVVDEVDQLLIKYGKQVDELERENKALRRALTNRRRLELGLALATFALLIACKVAL